MKRKTTASDAALFRKNLTRFAPVWMLYFVFLLLSFLMLFSGWEYSGYDFTARVSGTMPYMVTTGAIYSLICAQLLFGDLFNARLCNGIHALPVSRPQLFRVNFLSGLIFAWVPNLVITLFALLFTYPDGSLPGLWLLMACGSFLIFFALAVFCGLTTGSRFGMALLYGLIHAAAPIVYWLADTIYMPLLPGLVLDWEPFRLFCPVYQLTEDAANLVTYDTFYIDAYLNMTINPECLGYLAGLTALSLGLIVVDLVLYRRRQLEAAGDLMAFPLLRPAFLTAYTLIVGGSVYFLFEIFFSGSTELYLLVGIAIGFFTGCMLLARSPRVFTKRNFVLCGVFLALALSSVLITHWDPLGLVNWVPEAKQVESVTIHMMGTQCYVKDPEDIAAVLDSHEKALVYMDKDNSTFHRWYNIDYYYNLTDGRTVRRTYTVTNDSPTIAALTPALNKPEFVLGELYREWENIRILTLNDNQSGLSFDVDPAAMEDLLEALVADCEAGNMTRTWLRVYDYDMVHELYFHYKYTYPNAPVVTYAFDLQIYPEAVNTVAWLEDHGFLPDQT